MNSETFRIQRLTSGVRQSKFLIYPGISGNRGNRCTEGQDTLSPPFNKHLLTRFSDEGS